MSRSGDELRRRTKRFSSRVIRLYADLPRHRDEVQILGRQLLQAGTSVAAQVREASRACLEAAFPAKRGLWQEADERRLWLEHPMEDCALNLEELLHPHAEGRERIAIFVTMIAKLRRATQSISAFQLFSISTFSRP